MPLRVLSGVISNADGPVTDEVVIGFNPHVVISSGANHLYQSELKTLPYPTLVVLHFPIHAFHAGKSFQLA